MEPEEYKKIIHQIIVETWQMFKQRLTPEIQPDEWYEETIELFKTITNKYKDTPFYEYVRALVAVYETELRDVQTEGKLRKGEAA